MMIIKDGKMGAELAMKNEMKRRGCRQLGQPVQWPAIPSEIQLKWTKLFPNIFIEFNLEIFLLNKIFQVQVVVGEEELPDDDILDDVDDVDDVPDYVNDNPVIEVDDTGTPVCPPLVTILPILQLHFNAIQFNNIKHNITLSLTKDLIGLGGLREAVQQTIICIITRSSFKYNFM